MIEIERFDRLQEKLEQLRHAAAKIGERSLADDALQAIDFVTRWRSDELAKRAAAC